MRASPRGEALFYFAFDSTLCIGCGACYQACKEKNNLPRTASHFLRDNLSAKTYTVVKLRSGRFVRQMCMHCEQPACASVCPVAALQKIPKVVITGGALMSGIWWITNRRAAVQRAVREEKLRKTQAGDGNEAEQQ